MAALNAAASGAAIASISKVASSCCSNAGGTTQAGPSCRPALLQASFTGLHSRELPRPGRSAPQVLQTASFNAVKRSPRAGVRCQAAAPKKILLMGGTRFIGVFLARLLVKDGHEVTLFTRGKTPITQRIPGESTLEYSNYSSKVKHIQGDRLDFDGLKSKLTSTSFDVVYDINGREAAEVEPILDALPNLEQYIFCSSAGVYLKTDTPPHYEVDAVDPKSRHKGKLDTESLLASKSIPWTSIRPVYIYGPLNYNPVEEWFFHRLKAGRPIPVPSSGLQITQLGHVGDLATAFVKVLANETAYGQIYNISGEKYVTFDGIARACAKAGGFPEPELVHYNPKDFDFGKKKSFPLRDQHFFASVEKAKTELGWEPKYGLVDGLAHSFRLDFGRGTFRKAADFSTDDQILEKVGTKFPASAAYFGQAAPAGSRVG